MRRGEDGYVDCNERLELGWKNFLASLMVNARNECGWLSRTLTSVDVIDSTTRDGFSRERLRSAASHWRWVFWPDEATLSFAACCEDLGLDEMAARNRIMAHCERNPGINPLVNIVLAGD